MTWPRNIFLVGFMATGKTSVGRLLAQQTGYALTDADEAIVAQAGKSIDRIFAEEGEAAFRRLERRVIAEICAGRGQVAAAGGGAFLDAANRRAMLAAGLVFCLAASPEVILRRVQAADAGEPVRPLLAGAHPLERIRQLLAQRAPAYAQAHHTIPTDALTPAAVAGRIADICAQSQPTPAAP